MLSPVSTACFHLVLLLEADQLFRRIGVKVQVRLNREDSAAQVTTGLSLASYEPV
jgi:hypothetical protein